MLDNRVLLFSLENYRIAKSFIFDLDGPAEPTVQNVFSVFNYGRKQFKELKGQGFIMLLGGQTFYIAKKDEKGAKNYEIFKLGEEDVVTPDTQPAEEQNEEAADSSGG